MMEKSNSQYDSFLFWRQPIPVLDLSELEDLGLIDSCQMGKDKTSKLRSRDEEVRGENQSLSADQTYSLIRSVRVQLLADVWI